MGSKTPTRLLRVCREQSGSDREREEAEALEFTPLCAESLKQCFLRCDVDCDRKLSYAELKSFFSFTTGDDLSEHQFRGLVEVVEGGGRDAQAVSFNGLLSLYKMNYKELGTAKGDSLLWKDLSNFGFNADLTHSGNWPTNPAHVALDQAKAIALVKNCIAADKENWFCAPVDAVALGIPDYHDIIKSPIDLGTVLKNIEALKYNTLDEVRSDVRLTFTNALDYNPVSNPVAKAACKHLKTLELWQEDKKEPAFVSVRSEVVDLSATNGSTKRKPKKIASLFLKPGRSKRKQKASSQVKESKRPRVEAENLVDLSNTCDDTPLLQKARRLKKSTKMNPFFQKREKKQKELLPTTKTKKPVNAESVSHWTIVEFPLCAARELPEEESKVLRRSFSRTVQVGEWAYQPSCCSQKETTQMMSKYTANRDTLTQSERQALLSDEGFLELRQSLFPSKEPLDEQRVMKTLRGVNKSKENLWSEVYGGILKGRRGRDGYALKDWLKSWDEVLEQELSESDSDCLDGLTRALALVGRSGLGKTQLVYNMAHKLKYKVIEAGTCVRRSSTDLLSMIGECAQSNTMNNNRRGKDKALILVDDFDIVFDQDKGFFSALKSLISRTKVPIVLTCTTLPKEFDSPESGVCVVLSDTPTLQQVSEDLAYVCLAEGVCLERQLINRLVRLYNMDLRRLLNELQFYCFKRGVEDDKPLKQSKEVLSYPTRWFDEVWGLDVDVSNQTSSHVQKIIRYGPALNAYKTLYNKCIKEQPSEPLIPVVITKLEPRKGALSGGTVVTARGNGFLSNDYASVEVFVGDTRATDVWIQSDEDIVFRTPSYPNWEQLNTVSEEHKLKQDLVDVIEEFSDAEDFEIPRPKTPRARVEPCSVVIRCRKADGSVIASDDLVEERCKFLFSYRNFEPATNAEVDTSALKSRFVAQPMKARVSNDHGELEEMTHELEKLSSFDITLPVVAEDIYSPTTELLPPEFLKAELELHSGSEEQLRHAHKVLGNASFRRAYGVSAKPNDGLFTQLLPTLRKINSIEERRKELSVSRRFMHYFDRINLYDIDPDLAACFALDQ